jgi:hypothetical protein
MTAVPSKSSDRGDLDVETAAPAGREPRTGRGGRLAGVSLSIAGIAVLMGSITAEALHPGPYTTHADTLSHLGPTSHRRAWSCSRPRESSTARCSPRAC